MLDAPRIAPDYEGYDCPVTGKWIEGRKAHEENLKRTGCRIYEPGETREFQQRKAADEERFLEGIAEQAVAKVMQLPGEKRAQLGRELETSDVNYMRLAP